jgi:hypothetical protein
MSDQTMEFGHVGNAQQLLPRILSSAFARDAQI